MLWSSYKGFVLSMEIEAVGSDGCMFLNPHPPFAEVPEYAYSWRYRICQLVEGTVLHWMNAGSDLCPQCILPYGNGTETDYLGGFEYRFLYHADVRPVETVEDELTELFRSLEIKLMQVLTNFGFAVHSCRRRCISVGQPNRGLNMSTQSRSMPTFSIRRLWKS